MSQKLVVAFRPLQTCMVSLPPRWASALSDQNKGCMVFQLSWATRSAFVAWSGGVSRSSEHRDRSGALATDVLEIDGVYGSKLGLADGAVVSVKYEPDVVTCSMAEVVPEHFDDWEILELNAGAVESRLLMQARVVAVDQPIVFWLNKSTAVTLGTTNVRPKASVCLLDNDTEVVVAPKVRSANLADTQEDQTDVAHGRKQRQPISCLRIAAAVDGVPYGVVYTSPQSTIALQVSEQLDGPGDAVVRIGHSTLADITPGEDSPKMLMPWLAVLETSESVQPGVLLVSSATQASVGFAVGELVRVQPVPTTSMQTATQLSFVSEQPDLSTDDIRVALRHVVRESERSQTILNVGMSIPDPTRNTRQLARLVSFQTQSSETAIESSEVPICVTADQIESLEIDCTTEPLSLDAGDAQNIQDVDTASETVLAGVDAFLEDAWHSVESALMSRYSAGSGVLLCGRRGSGKTSIAQHLKHRIELQQRNRLVYCRHVDCTRLSMHPQTSAIRDTLQRIAHDVLTNQPSLLILDDLDGLLPAETEQSDSKRVQRLVDALVSALDQTDGRQVTVVATAAGRTQLHAKLFASGVFQSVLEIPAPGKAEREEILAAIARGNATPADPADVNYSLLSYLTEGYMPADLHELYERAVHEATMRVLDQPEVSDVLVKHVDIVRAHSGFKPMSLRGVQLQTSQTRWSDIGGLEDTRRQLRETLELPTRYAAIFATSPLRLRSGVLLFGYPGCGKTLLASAIARECGLNFIATKGPELLSKYIGSSEQSVRDLFKRAVAASPCVLFFDEFESIAPRRGHDNTGVTDRVVNQFLTEMDGAEGLKGVYVLAATSRPDLIDPALLRPGRLDKAFLCDMPTVADRMDILSKQANKVKTANVDWNTVAQRTEGFTGADLQALVYNAFLEAVHEMTAAHANEARQDSEESKLAEFTLIAEAEKPLSKVERTLMAERLFRLVHQPRSAESVQNEAAQTAIPVVTMAHFDKALEMTQSSLGDQDRARFATIFRDFVDDKKGDKPRQPIEQRATMA
ncbi:Peroxisome biosynthesis protein pex1 [Coemansia sp. RSA 1822]|nr:Peroxisome biosynthesis protein pex1 [Coemansia sp. RSA 638]KAJ2561152.1 Peroxisome biosynthesis protein pex1 [Coemansia sp. RSA 1822]